MHVALAVSSQGIRNADSENKKMNENRRQTFQICLSNHNVEEEKFFPSMGSNVSVDLGTELDVDIRILKSKVNYGMHAKSGVVIKSVLKLN
jgi:hypothetical protein